MSTAPVVPTPPKSNWFKRTFGFMGHILKIAVAVEPKIASIVVPALEQAFPALAVPIAAGDALATKIVKQILVTETLASAVATAPTNADKLNTTVAGVEGEIDQWMQNLFPGSAKLSTVATSGLVEAFLTAVKEVEPGVTTSPAA